MRFLLAAIATSDPIELNDYSVDASLYLEWSKSGNRGGVVYDYRDDQNYRGVLVSANGANYVGPVEIFEVGQSFFEPPGATHLISANASNTEPAELIAVFVADEGAQLTTLVK